MSEQEITRIEDVREGDLVTLRTYGREWTLDAWVAPNEKMRVGGSVLSFYDGGNPDHVFVGAVRTVPDLPTERGSSVIIAREVRGERGEWIMRLGGDGYWRRIDTGKIGGCLGHLPEHVTEWEPAMVVPATVNVDALAGVIGDSIRSANAQSCGVLSCGYLDAAAAVLAHLGLTPRGGDDRG